MPKSRYSQEFQDGVVKQFMERRNELTIKGFAREIGIDKQTLRNWLENAGIDTRANSTTPLSATGYDAAQRLRVVAETFSLNEIELGQYARANGLYVEQIKSWRAAFEKPDTSVDKSLFKAMEKKLKQSEYNIKLLEKNVERKDKALAEASALLILSKKVQALLGDEAE